MTRGHLGRGVVKTVFTTPCHARAGWHTYKVLPIQILADQGLAIMREVCQQVCQGGVVSWQTQYRISRPTEAVPRMRVSRWGGRTAAPNGTPVNPGITPLTGNPVSI